MTGGCVNVGGRLVVRATRVGADTQLAQHRPAGHPGAGGQGARCSASRTGSPPSSSRSCSCSPPRRWPAGWRRAASPAAALHRRRGGADHRLPVRDGPGHADRDPGRHRPGRAARHPDQGTGGAGEHPPGGHRGARQDRHDHDRPDDAGRRGRRARRARDRAAPAGRRGGDPRPSTRSPPRSPQARATARRRVGAVAARWTPDVHDVSDFAAHPGPRRLRRRRRVTRSRRPARLARPRVVAGHPGRRWPRWPSARTGPRRAGQTAIFVAWDGRVRGVLDRWPTRSSPPPPAAVARLRAMGLHPVLLTGDNERAARAVAGQVGIDDVIAGVRPGGKLAAIKGLQDRRPDGGHGRRRRERRRRARPGRPGPGDGHRHRRGHRGRRPDPGQRRPARGAPTRSPCQGRRSGRSRRNLGWAFGYNAAAIPLAASGLLNPTDRGRRDGVQLGVRGHQQPAPAPLQPRSKMRGMPSSPATPRPATPRPVPTSSVTLTGWGRIAPTTAELATPATGGGGGRAAPADGRPLDRA